MCNFNCLLGEGEKQRRNETDGIRIDGRLHGRGGRREEENCKSKR